MISNLSSSSNRESYLAALLTHWTCLSRVISTKSASWAQLFSQISSKRFLTCFLQVCNNRFLVQTNHGSGPLRLLVCICQNLSFVPSCTDCSSQCRLESTASVATTCRAARFNCWCVELRSCKIWWRCHPGRYWHRKNCDKAGLCSLFPLRYACTQALNNHRRWCRGFSDHQGSDYSARKTSATGFPIDSSYSSWNISSSTGTQLWSYSKL